MKKISTLAGIVAAAALLCGISGCDNSETITMTSAKIEMVGDPIVTDKAAIFQWKDSVANGYIVITRQAPGEEEVTIATTSSNVFADRVTYSNLLKAGVEYTYRFYNESGVSSARTTEYTLEQKYGCVERKVTFESIAPAGTKLAPLTEEQIKIVKSESNGNNYLSIYVDEKEACAWITIEDDDDWARVWDDEERDYVWKRNKYENLYNSEIGGLESFKYDPYHNYIIFVGKYWPEDADWNKGDEKKRYYDKSDTEMKFDLAATKNNSISFNVWNDDFELSWKGKKDSTYEVSFEAFDNQKKPITLTSKIANDKIKRDDFYTCKATGKLSNFTTASKSIKTIKAILKETTADKTVYESEIEKNNEVYYTTYTKIGRLNVSYGDYDTDEGGYPTQYYARVTLEGYNLPATAKLYYKYASEPLYTEVKDGLKKETGSSDLTARVPVNGYNDNYYDFKAVVTMDNDKWYDWEEGKTEEVAERTYWNYNNY